MFGTPFYPAFPRATFPGGVDLGPLAVIPTGGTNVTYVRSTGPQSGDPLEMQNNLVSTLNAGLARCRSGRGDYVVVLPGHAENISAADQMSSLVAGTNIVGMGRGANRGTFTWTAATATFLLDVANVTVSNLRLFMAGPHAAGTALTVAAPMTVSAAGCQILGCDIWAGFDADQIATFGILVTGNDFKFLGNRVRAEAAAVGTTFIRLTGCDSPEIGWNDIIHAGTTTVGAIQVLTTAATNINIHDNKIQNATASSTACITGLANTTGWIANNQLRVMTDGGVAHIGTPGNTQLFQNFGVNNNGETGIQVGTASV